MRAEYEEGSEPIRGPIEVMGDAVENKMRIPQNGVPILHVVEGCISVVQAFSMN